jgi:hypothetical protein
MLPKATLLFAQFSTMHMKIAVPEQKHKMRYEFSFPDSNNDAFFKHERQFISIKHAIKSHSFFPSEIVC